MSEDQGTAADVEVIAPTIEQTHPAGPGGIQRLYYFENGFGASVIQSRYSYGGPSGLWELAVLRRQADASRKREWQLTYDTPITDDVIGHLNEDEAQGLLRRIRALP